MIEICIRLSEEKYRLGSYAESVKYGERAVLLCHKEKMHKDASHAMELVLNSLHKKGDYASLYEKSDEYLKMLESCDTRDPITESMVLMKKGLAGHELGRKDSTDYLIRSVDIM